MKINIDISSMKSENRNAYFVVKSNFYGYGIDMIFELRLRNIVVADENELFNIIEKVKVRQNEVERIIVLYPDFLRYRQIWNTEFFFEKYKIKVMGCANSIDDIAKIREFGYDRKRIYIRSDCFLSMHGLSLDYVSHIDDFRGIFLHVNEFLDSTEKRKYREILEKAHNCGIKMNVSLPYNAAFNKYADREYKTEKNNITKNIENITDNSNATVKQMSVEYRYAHALLYNCKNESNFVICTTVINKHNAENEEITIGYKSCQKTIDRGFVYLVKMGYGDSRILVDIYEHSILLHFRKHKFIIPVYPCMNTCWLWSANDICDDEIILFEKFGEIKKLCEELDIDMDEFTSSFDSSICREYISARDDTILL